MSTIHMDVDAARRVKKRLLEIKGQILNDIRRPNMTVSNLQPSWRSNSANEFFALYNASSGKISAIAEKLGEIAEELEEQIERWERIAERLSR